LKIKKKIRPANHKFKKYKKLYLSLNYSNEENPLEKLKKALLSNQTEFVKMTENR
jgi:hypothetical protein